MDSSTREPAGSNVYVRNVLFSCGSVCGKRVEWIMAKKTKARVSSPKIEREKAPEEKESKPKASSRTRATEQKEPLLEAIVNALPVLISEVDAHERYQFNNATYEEWFGVPTNALKGRLVRDVLGAAAYEAIKEHIQMALAGQPRTFEEKVPYKTAGARDVHVHYIPHRDADGAVVGFHAFIFDITQRKNAEAQLLHAAAVIESSEDAILSIDRQGLIQSWNPGAQRLYGYGPDEVLGQPVSLLSPPEMHSALSDTLERIRRGERIAHFETTRLKKDGTRFEASLTLSPIRDAMGCITSVSAIARDITEQKRVEESLRESEQRFRVAAESGNDLIYEWDLQSDEMRWWGKMDASLGYQPKTLQAWEKTLHPEDHDKVMKAVTKHLQQGEAFDQEYRVRRRDGTYRYWSDRGTALRDARGKPYTWIGACTDITERKQVEQKLRKLTQQLLNAQEEERSNLSRELHDVFSQRLAALAMMVGEFEDELTQSPAVAQETIRKVQEEIGRIAENIHDLSRQLHPAILDDLGLAAALRNECGVFSKQHGIPTGFFQDNVPSLIPPAIELCLYRVAQESLHNITKHAHAEEVRVSLTFCGADLVLVIEDTGEGFDMGERRGKGGLGLVSMEERLRLVNGTFSIQSVPGQGTRVEACVRLSN